MSAFTDRVKKYNDNKTTTVPVNPPEAAAVLETQVAPEVANDTPKPVVDAPSAPPELTKGQRAAATRAANKAAASATAPSAEPEKEAPTTHELPASIAPVARSAELQAADYFVQRLNDLGYTVTLTKAPR